MAYRPLADSPEEHIALRARRISHDDDVELDGELDFESVTATGPAEDVDVTKPFPVDPLAPEEEHQFTFRAVLVGCLLGSVGFTFGSSLFGAIFGYAILKPLSQLPSDGLFGRYLGGHFGPKENCTVQSAATAAGALGTIFVSAVPAMYLLKLLSPSPSQDVGRLIAISACAAFFGACFAVPLRAYFVMRTKLAFPTPTATAYTIRTLHAGTAGAAVAAKKSKALSYSFAGVFVWKILGGYAPGVIVDWHIGWWLSRVGPVSIAALENYGWWLEVTPAFFGAGMLSGLNASWSFLGGTFLAWGVLSPWIVSKGLAVGTQPYPTTFPELWRYTDMTFSDPDKYRTSPSPRYWLLWPGVLIMLVNSFTDVAFSIGPILWRLRPQAWKPQAVFAAHQSTDHEEDSDPSEQVPRLWWTAGILVSVILSTAILSTTFGMTVIQALLALVMGFLFSFIGIQSAGQTDVNPLSTVAKASQVIFGGLTRHAGVSMATAQTVNLSAGVVAAGCAGQATDMIGDLKTGHLLRAAPRAQFLAQIVGSTVSIALNVGLFILFARAAPCILDGSAPCAYPAPAVTAWAAVAVGVTSPVVPVPPSSAYAAVGLSALACMTVIAKHTVVPEKYKPYMPNWNAIGLGFVVHQTFYSIAMVVGAVANQYWERRGPKSHEMYMFAISAGLLAGEGMGGVAQAMLSILKLDGGRQLILPLSLPQNPSNTLGQTGGELPSAAQQESSAGSITHCAAASTR